MIIRHKYRCTQLEIAHIEALQVDGVEAYAIGEGKFKMYQKPNFLTINVAGMVCNGEIYTIEKPKIEPVQEVKNEEPNQVQQPIQSTKKKKK